MRSAPRPPTSWRGAGTSVIGLERFELGHTRGASHDTSRILRHSYHTPAYVRLTQDAYADWARLERDSGAGLVTKVGGLDLFPPGAAIPADRLHRVARGGRHRPRGARPRPRWPARWPQFRLPERHAGALPARRRDRARRAGAPARCRSRRRGTAPTCATHSPVTACSDLGDARHRGGDRRRVRSAATGWWSARTPGSTTSLGRPRRAGAARGDARAGHLLPAGASRRGSRRSGCRCGSGWTTRPTTASRRYGEATIKAAQDCGGPTVDPDGRTSEPRPGDGGAPRRVRAPTCSRAAAAGALVALPVHADPRPRLRDRAGAGAPSVVVGLGAAHGFKFAPTFGRLLADLVADGGTDDRSDRLPAGPPGA